MRQRRLQRHRLFLLRLRVKRTVRKRRQRTMGRGKRRTRPGQPSLIILQLPQPAPRELAMRLLATGRRRGRIRRRPGRRRLSRQQRINRLPRLNPGLSLRRLRETGLRRNERKASGGLRPDFLSDWLALAGSMRLSLMKAAHKDVGERLEAGNPGRPSFSAHVRPGDRGAPVLVKRVVWGEEIGLSFDSVLGV
jgi:hypothetical protein